MSVRQKVAPFMISKKMSEYNVIGKQLVYNIRNCNCSLQIFYLELPTPVTEDIWYFQKRFGESSRAQRKSFLKAP